MHLSFKIRKFFGVDEIAAEYLIYSENVIHVHLKYLSKPVNNNNNFILSFKNS